MKHKTAIVEEKIESHEDQLIHTQKMEAMSTLANGIAHDFNNILSGIVGYSEVALSMADKDKPVTNIIERILDVCDRAKILIDPILSFSRQNWQAGDEEHMRLAPVIEEVIRLLSASLPDNIEISKNIPKDSGMIYASRTMIHKVIINLFTNSMQAMKEKGGTLAIGLKDISVDKEFAIKYKIIPGQYLELSVSDTGPGIPENIMEKIFDPYFTTKGKGEGKGLGLSVVYGIVKNYKGALKVNSIPDTNTTFDILLPRIEIEDLS